MIVEKALRRLILSDPEIAGQFAKYDFGGAAPEPALFRFAPAPDDAISPYGVIELVGASAGVETPNCNEMEIIGNVAVFGAKERNADRVMALAMAIYEKIHRSVLDGVLEGGWTGVCVADFPQPTANIESFPGQLINFRATLNKGREL